MGVTALIASHMLLLSSYSPGQVSTVYGFGETYCGDVASPAACSVGAVTATGDAFDPAKPTAAIPLPANRRLRKGFHIYLRHGSEGPCVPILVNDKMNDKYRGNRNFDLTPAAVHALTGKYPTKYWSSTEVQRCHFISSNVRDAKPNANIYRLRSILNTLTWSVVPAVTYL